MMLRRRWSARRPAEYEYSTVDGEGVLQGRSCAGPIWRWGRLGRAIHGVPWWRLPYSWRLPLLWRPPNIIAARFGGSTTGRSARKDANSNSGNCILKSYINKVVRMYTWYKK